ncbi:MAG: hypothetical protein LQ348_007375, partial [Seirophora lacunosa]
RREYLVGAFLPTALAVVFSIPWHILFAAVQDIEPFYQLNHPQGVLARDTIYLDYRASVNVVAVIKAGWRGHFVVFSAGLCSIAVLILAPLASETVFIGFVGRGTMHGNLVPRRLSSATKRRHRGGACRAGDPGSRPPSDPLSRRRHLDIAGIATLFQHSRLVDEFRNLDPHCAFIDNKSLQMQLRGNRYRLRHFQHLDQSMDYGIERCIAPITDCDDIATSPHDSRTTSHKNKKKKLTTGTVTPVDAELQRSRKPRQDYLVHPATVTAFVLFVAGLLTLVVYYYSTGGDTGFERFMDSQTVGVTFMFTAIGVLIKMYWAVLDDNLRATHPYRLLLHASWPSSAPRARESILASPPADPFLGLVYSLQRKAWLPSWLSLVAILTEPPIIALANIPFKAQATFEAYRVSTYVTMSLMLLGLLGVLNVLREERVSGEEAMRGIEVARDRTVGSVMGLLCGSTILSDLRGLAEMGTEERDSVVMGWQKRYKMGDVLGVDGAERWGIDDVCS